MNDYNFTHTDSNNNPTNATVRAEAREIVAEVLRYHPIEERDDVVTMVHHMCEEHQWAIYSYAALQLVTHCSTAEAEDTLYDLEYTPTNNIGEYACAIVQRMLIDACFDALADLNFEA